MFPSIIFLSIVQFLEPDAKTWMTHFIESFEDTTVLVLMAAAGISLVVGTYEDISKGWIEGVAILVAVIVVAVVTATNNSSKEEQFRALNKVKEDVDVTVLRNGDTKLLNVQDLVVGDVVRLLAGDKVPADGVMVNGSDVVCNESSLTGESEEKNKSSPSQSKDCFLLSGTCLVSGYCHMLVTAVGSASRWGKTKACLEEDKPDTPLQERLDALAGLIGMCYYVY